MRVDNVQIKHWQYSVDRYEIIQSVSTYLKCI